ESKCRELAAESGALKASIPPLKMINDVTDSWDDVSLAEDVGFNLAISAIMKNLSETQATDAFLAEVRAQGADECVRQLVTSDDDDFSDAPNICAMVAHQLRKGAAHHCSHCGGIDTCSECDCTATDQMLEQYRASKGAAL
ncbi:MAG: hypothetical protein ACRC8G_01970, partial [Plesiomonas shigelloides]